MNAVAGTEYRIAVDGKTAANGMFSLEIQGPPENDDFATPKVLSPVPLSAGGSTLLATKQSGEPNHAGQPGGRSLWFSWTPDASGTVELSACTSRGDLDTVLAVYTGAVLGA